MNAYAPRLFLAVLKRTEAIFRGQQADDLVNRGATRQRSAQIAYTGSMPLGRCVLNREHVMSCFCLSHLNLSDPDVGHCSA